MTERLEKVVTPLAEEFSGRVAVAFQSFQTSESFVLNATAPMSAASLIKLPLLVHALSEVAQGRLELDRRYLLKSADQVGGAGILHVLEPRLEPTLHDLLTLMIVVSDNTATNLVIDILGLGATNAFIQALGMAQTKLVGKLQLPEERLNEGQRRGERNRTCAADILGLLARLERRDLLPDELTRIALAILKSSSSRRRSLATCRPTRTSIRSPWWWRARAAASAACGTTPGSFTTFTVHRCTPSWS